jgi:hypothetical protein
VEEVTVTPIERSFAHLDRDEHWLVAQVGWGDDGWTVAGRVAIDRRELEALRDAVVAALGPADPLTDGVMMMWRYADMARVATIVYALDRRLPDLSPDRVAFVPATNSEPERVAFQRATFSCLPDDPDAAHHDARVVSDPGALRQALVDRLEAFIWPVIEPMRTFTGLGRRGLWGIAASVPLVAMAHALAERGEAARGVAEVEAALAIAGSLRIAPPVVEVVRHAGRDVLVIRDGACCRAYRRPDGELCTSCPIRPREERIARFVDFAEREAASTASG